ncbi:hypothetical protein MNBD_ACTINO02-1958 [hydrothermal vent metagenome]|uniref:Uncharacterized protein n=1 Tax=hydrothermal vent metagenome TaxID=652676 RepID=A0A3B0STP0_9ZZZZ
MDLPKPAKQRWWRYKRTWLLGLPGVAILGVVGLFVWGSFQPKPLGFAPTDPDEVAEVTEDWILYTVDARSKTDWVLFDFEKGRVVEGEFTAPGWDVAFKRTKLLTNSGVTNPAGPGGAYGLGEVPLELASPPASVPFAVDSLGGEDDDEPGNIEAGKWYSYSFISHIVTTKPDTYLIRTGETRDALVQFDSYYCEDEESGCITFRYRLVKSVPDSGTQAASSGE